MFAVPAGAAPVTLQATPIQWAFGHDVLMLNLLFKADWAMVCQPKQT
jgi:hypothetical protein